MPVNKEAYKLIIEELQPSAVVIVAVSKTRSIGEILELYRIGHRDFGENYVQELVEKAEKLPKDIRWHFIGHLQTNKVKLIVPFVQLIHGVDSLKLLKEIEKEAAKVNRVVDCLLQVHIAAEDTKFGLDEVELRRILEEFEKTNFCHVRICGLMGMASFTSNEAQIRSEFSAVKKKAELSPSFHILSMGMSSDFKIAVQEGSTMVRIGSLLFGEREKK